MEKGPSPLDLHVRRVTRLVGPADVAAPKQLSLVDTDYVAQAFYATVAAGRSIVGRVS